MNLGRPKNRFIAAFVFCIFLLAFLIFRPANTSEANSSGGVLMVPSITATKVDSIATDVDTDGRADPGDTLLYTITISNSGTDSLNTIFNDTISSNTTLVPGSVNSSPIAFDDPSYTATGNVRITIPAASGVLANDIDPDTGNNSGLTASAGATSVQGGNVAMSANGGFSYNPAPGFTGTDTFTYTVTDPGGATGTGTVTFNVSGMIWFINAAAGGGGDGRLTSPFNCYTGAGCFSAVAADDPGDNIFLYTGAYTGGNALLANQRLIGQGAGASLSTITGITPPTGSDALPATAGTRPTITTGAGTSGVLLGSGNTLRGFNIGNTGTTDITGTSFGTLTIQDMELNGTGRLVDLATGTVAATFDNFISTTGPGGQAVNLNGVGGTLTVLGATSITTPGGQGINIAGSAVAASFGTSTTITDPTTQGILVGTSTGNVSFGNTTISDATDAISLQNNSAGTRSFGTITVTNGSGDSFLHGVGGGTTTVSGVATLTNPASNCIDIQDSTTAVTFANVNCTQSAAAGVFLDGNSGNVTFADIDIDTDANVRAFQATTNTGTITTTSGTIADTGTATAVEIVGTSAASRTPLNMQLTSVSANGPSSGIIVTNTMTAGAPGGFRVLGTGTTDGSGGTIQNTTGRGASFINSANIVLNNMNFTNAGTSDLDATNGGLSTGDNLDTNAAIHLISVTGITTLDNLNLTGTMAEQGINGNGVSNFTLANSSIVNAGNEADEDGIHFFNMSGTSAITNTILNCTVVTPNTTGGDDHLNLQTNTGTLNLTISGGSATNANKGSGYLFGIRGNTNATINFTGASSQANFSGGIVADAFDTATMALTVSGGSNSTGNNDQLSVSAGDSTTVDLNANGSTFGSPNVGDFVVISLLGSAFDTGYNFDARIQNNTITVGNGRTADGIAIFNAGGGAINTLITGNTIDYAGTQRAILAQAGQDGNGSTNLTMTGNNIDIELDGAGNAVAGILAQTAITGPGNTSSMCADIGGAGGLSNTWTHSLGGTMAGGDIRVRQRNDGTMRLPGYVGGATDLTAVASFLNGRNVEVSPTTATADSSGFAGGGACTQPNPIAPSSEEKASNIIDGLYPALSFLHPSNNTEQTEDDEVLVDYFMRDSRNDMTDVSTAESIVHTDNFIVPNDNLTVLTADFTVGNDASTTANTDTANRADDQTGYSTVRWVYSLVSKVRDMISPTVYAQEQRPLREDGIKDPEITPESPVSGETITVNGGSINGFTLPAGRSITITFRASINSGVLPAFTQVSNQGTVSATGIANVLTDDPDIAGTANPTVTNIDHTTVAVASNANPSVFGQNVTFTATMTGVPSRASDPPGTVQFKADGVNIGSPVAVVVGTANDNVSTAQASISTLAIGNRVITAEYSGGGVGITGYNANTGTLSGGQLVGQANTTVGVVSNANPSVSGQSVTFTATVSVTAPGSGTPTGNVSFRDNGMNIGTCAAQTVSANVATCSISTLSVSTHPITAVYNGDSNFNASPPSTAVSQVVNKANTSVALTSSQNPAPLGTNVTFTAAISITSPGTGTTSGTVQFRDGATPIAGCSAVTVAMNSAACSTTALTVGNHTISAIYSGDTNFNTSTGNLTGNPQVITGPPVLVPAVGLSRVKSAPATNSQIGTVSDDVSSPGSIVVTVQTAPTGISVTNIVNNNGTITADIAAGCAAATGPATVVLNAADGKGLSQNANLGVNILANPAPTLGSYANQTVVSSCKLFITPTAAPNDNVPLTSVTVTSGTFGGTLSVDQTTGLVTASNANPVPGPHTVTVTATDSCGVQTTSNFTITVAPTPTAPKDFDFDGDRKADISVYRAGATANAVSTWFILRSSDSTVRINQFGNGEDRIVPADYTGDGTFDLAVFRPSTSTWYYSSDQINPGQNFTVLKWGAAGDIPVPGRFDADNKTDIAIWRPSTGQWWIARSTGGTDVRSWGLNGDKPIAADVDGDGMSDLIQYRASNFSFYALKSGGGNSITPFGIAGDRLIPADYDGDGIDDLAVYRPSTNQWWIQQSSGGLRLEVWGQSGDVPAPADYDNDGKVDLAIFRPADGTWWIFSSCPCVLTGSQFGIGTDIAVPSVITP